MSVFHFDHALVRTPGRSVVGGLRAEDRGNPTYEGVLAEHAAYVAALEAAGVAVEVLPPARGLSRIPSSSRTRRWCSARPPSCSAPAPRAGSARPKHLRPELEQRFNRVLELTGDGFADGGDILVTPSEVLIGLSARTDRPGAGALATCLASIGRAARVVETPPGVLHFKTACSLLADTRCWSPPRSPTRACSPGCASW